MHCLAKASQKHALPRQQYLGQCSFIKGVLIPHCPFVQRLGFWQLALHCRNEACLHTVCVIGVTAQQHAVLANRWKSGNTAIRPAPCDQQAGGCCRSSVACQAGCAAQSEKAQSCEHMLTLLFHWHGHADAHAMQVLPALAPAGRRRQPAAVGDMRVFPSLVSECLSTPVADPSSMSSGRGCVCPGGCHGLYHSLQPSEHASAMLACSQYKKNG